jgi:hypothetical protein
LKQSFALSIFSPSSFRKASRGLYPTRLSTGRPLQKSRSVGVPMIPYFRPISLFPSLEKMFNFANFSLPEKSPATAFSSGSSLLHQMHASCQKSTSTSCCDFATCSSQFAESRSMIELTFVVSMGTSTLLECLSGEDLVSASVLHQVALRLEAGPACRTFVGLD